MHYHIRWSDSKIDWQAFNTAEDAQKEAERLARPGETYAIEKFGPDCSQCKATGFKQSADWKEKSAG